MTGMSWCKTNADHHECLEVTRRDIRQERGSKFRRNVAPQAPTIRLNEYEDPHFDTPFDSTHDEANSRQHGLSRPSILNKAQTT
jgi:hypothetical protein